MVAWKRVRGVTATGTVCLLLAALATIVHSPEALAEATPQLVSSDSETVPVLHSGDAMDDPAVWVHPTDPTRSLLLGNDKGGGLETYDLDGSLVQRLDITGQFWGNVDVRQGVTIAGRTRDLVGASQKGARFYTVDPENRQLVSVTEGAAPIGTTGEGFCMYESAKTHQVYGIAISRAGRLTQFRLTDVDDDGLLESTTVRSFEVGSEAEGCVADDATGALYVSEEDVALWRYSAEPGAGATREAVDVLASQGGRLVSDIEGVTLVDETDGGGYVIVSVQNGANPSASFFNVYQRGAGNDFVKSFRVADGASSDDCDRTDGVTAVTADLGPAFPRGMFVCQDNNNDLPGTTGHQDLKMVRLERVVDLDAQGSPPRAPGVSFVSASTTNRNSTAFSVRTPSPVRPGDLLLLFASQGNTVAPGGPGAGWTRIGRVVDGSHASTLWRRAATASDLGAQITVRTGARYTKMGLTVAAYRGADTSDPIGVLTAAGEPGRTATHTTPTVKNAIPGATRVSYWSDKNSSSTRWTNPAGELIRAATHGTGGGRMGTLLTDAESGSTAGVPSTTGGVAVTADAAASSATMWTILLRPAR